MRVTVNGVVVPAVSPDGQLHVVVDVEPQGEILPVTTLQIVGGKLDVYRSKFTRTGNLSLHIFSDPQT